MQTPSDKPNSPSVEEPSGTVYFSADSSYFQDFSAFQKQNFHHSFQDPHFQQSSAKVSNKIKQATHVVFSFPKQNSSVVERYRRKNALKLTERLDAYCATATKMPSRNALLVSTVAPSLPSNGWTHSLRLRRKRKMDMPRKQQNLSSTVSAPQ